MLYTKVWIYSSDKYGNPGPVKYGNLRDLIQDIAEIYPEATITQQGNKAIDQDGETIAVRYSEPIDLSARE